MEVEAMSKDERIEKLERENRYLKTCLKVNRMVADSQNRILGDLFERMDEDEQERIRNASAYLESRRRMQKSGPLVCKLFAGVRRLARKLGFGRSE